MPKIESYKQGSPSWADYGAPDQHAAKVFYSDIFGWNYEDNPIDMGEGTMFYSMGMKNRSHTAAIYTQNSDQAEMDVPPHWLVYITVDDVDAIAAKVPDLGLRSRPHGYSAGPDRSCCPVLAA